MGINNLFKYGYTVFNNVVSDEIVKDFNKTFPSVPVFSKVEYSFEGQIRGDINHSNEETRDARETLDKFKIKDIIESSDYIVQLPQYWYWCSIPSHPSPRHWNEIESIIIKKLKEIYKNYELLDEDTHVEMHIMPPYTFISRHDDGVVENRLGAFLLPLNNKPRSGKGGDLVMNYGKSPDQQSTDIIESNVGDLIVLDFTQNNIEHEVTMIKNWIRLSLVGFFYSKS
jgi:hypothetical protein